LASRQQTKAVISRQKAKKLENNKTKKLPKARSFKDLIVYQKAKKFALKVFERSKRFPKEETYSLTNQIRRSSRSVGAQIAEAWAKRLYERHFISKLTDADAELQETKHWIEVANDCGYLSQEEARSFNSELKEIGSMLDSMIAKAHLFRRTDIPRVGETVPEYNAESIDAHFSDET
jgi:four helix bundle protein